MTNATQDTRPLDPQARTPRPCIRAPAIRAPAHRGQAGVRAILAKCAGLGHRRAPSKEGPTLPKTIVPAIYSLSLLVFGALGLIR